MPLYLVTYQHPDEAGWQVHLRPHVDWLKLRLADGALIASGPFPGEPVKSAMLIMAAPDRAALEAIIATDPFASHGLIDNVTIREWDPIFGAFNTRSSMTGRT